MSMSKWLGFGRQPEVSSPKLSRTPTRETQGASHGSSQESTYVDTKTDQERGRCGDATAERQGSCQRARESLTHKPGSSPDDWEFVGDDELCLHAQGELLQQLSPGVDLARPDHERDRPLASGGAEDCKWMDARTTHSFLVRGPTYMEDKEKRPAGPAMCKLVGVDCFVCAAADTTRVDHIASRGACREKMEALTAGAAPFLFIMNIQVGGTPPLSLVIYWALDESLFAEATAALHEGSGPEDWGTTRAPHEKIFALLLARCSACDENEDEKLARTIVDGITYAEMPTSTFGGACAMTDPAPPPSHTNERNRRFKLIPRMVNGPWMLRKAIGSTPVLLGTKITHRYYRGHRYIETDLDTASSPAAATLCGRCRGLSRKLDVELGVVLQANSEDELPEALLGAVRLNGFGVEDPILQRQLYPPSVVLPCSKCLPEVEPRGESLFRGVLRLS